jgi:hypothetical protein
MEFAAVYFGGDFIFYCVAGGVAVSRFAAELFGASVEERVGGMVDGIGAFWIGAHHEYGVPELAVRNSGDDRGNILWMDVEEERVDIRVGGGACGGGCGLAFFVSDGVRERNRGSEIGDRERKSFTGWSWWLWLRP